MVQSHENVQDLEEEVDLEKLQNLAGGQNLDRIDVPNQNRVANLFLDLAEVDQEIEKLGNDLGLVQKNEGREVTVARRKGNVHGNICTI